MKQKLEEMISVNAYNEIVRKIKGNVGEDVFEIIFPSIKKALEEGIVDDRYAILIDWLDVDSMRVCSHCGKIMEKGWQLGTYGYACSDECCMSLMYIGKEEFDKYSIYKPEIEQFLADEGKGRTLESLTNEEIEKITDNILENLDDYFYTEWN